MFSKFFIDRPIFATVLALLMIFAGILTVKTLPIGQYPDNISPPTVSVSASYPGANAETVAKAVAVPIEEHVNGVQGMLYMSSTCGSDGSYSLTVTFHNDVNLDDAAVEVQNRVSQASAQIPSVVTEEGIDVRKESTDNVLFISLNSDDPQLYDALYLTNYAQLNITDALSRVEGVGAVNAFGGGEYSMRIWLDPLKMRARNITPADVAAAIEAQNIEVSPGSVGNPPGDANAVFSFTLTTQGQLTTAKQFGDIILRADGNSLLRLKDVADVELGSTNYTAVSKINGEETALIGVAQRPGANALKVANGTLKKLEELSQYFPEGIHYNVVLNATDYVNASIDDVFTTFIITTLIVMVVILIFLQNWRAVIIPMITIPVSLIATFAIMKVLGFSLNTLTLFGLVLAIAIVVDDAIVVVEDCSRIVDKGLMTRREAAEKAMRELQGPIVGEVLVLLSVFIPTAFISGITGELYKQFALTIAVSTAFSGFNALTLTPALCALFLTPRKPTKFFLFKWFNKGFGATEKGYGDLTAKMLAHPFISIIIYFAISGVAFYGLVKWPSGYIPSEDQGYFMTSIQLPDGASLERTEQIVDDLSAEIKKIPYVKDVMSVAGYSMMGAGALSNYGSYFVILEPWSKRGKKGSVDKVIEMVDEISERYQEAIIFSINPPAIPGLGVSSGLQMQLLDINSLGTAAMMEAMEEIEEAASKDHRIKSITSLWTGLVPQYAVNIDRSRVELQNLSIEDVYNALSSYMGSAFVNDFIDFGRIYRVIVQGNGNSRATVESIPSLSVRNSDGKMVPFSTFAKVEPMMGAPSVSRYNMYTTASLTATPASGVSSSEGIQAMEEIVHKTLGRNFSYAWTGIAYQETQSGTTISFVFIFAIIMTILVLAAQYESWTSPIAVVLSMPMAILGTILGCIIMKQSLTIYTQIGLILLLGMSAKNAILIVEYAMDFRKAGVDIRKAAHDAGVIRFRPILMTACAFVFGVMPMMFATGAGANSRIDLGSAVVFGMAMNAIFGTLFVPNLWELMQKFQEKYLDGLFKDPAPSSEINSQDGDSSAASSTGPSSI